MRGFAYIITGGSPIGVTNPKFTFLGTGYVFNLIPLPVIFMIIVLILGMILVKHTRFGRYIYSCGGNAQAAKWSGINVDKIRITVYVIAGFLNGFAAIILAGRLGGGLPATGEGQKWMLLQRLCWEEPVCLEEKANFGELSWVC